MREGRLGTTVKEIYGRDLGFSQLIIGSFQNSRHMFNTSILAKSCLYRDKSTTKITLALINSIILEITYEKVK